jgi:hypothetical protein
MSFKVKSKLEDLVGKKVQITLDKRAKAFHSNLWITDRFEEDGLIVSGLLTEVNKHGVFFHHFCEGLHVWAQAKQAFEEGKLDQKRFWEERTEPMFFPWHSIVAIGV